METEVAFLVSVLVEPATSTGVVTTKQAMWAARQAICNALWDCEESGFDHDLADKATVQLAGISLVETKKGSE